MRLFVAIVPPAEVAGELGAVVAEARAAVPELRWVPPANWHLTLAFLGAVEPSQLPELEVRLARAAARHEPMATQLSGGGQFSRRILYAGVSGDRTALTRLARSVQAGARRAGVDVDVDDRAFRPHLTLARSNRPADLSPAAAVLSSWSSSPWSAAELVLMASRPPAGVGHPPTYAELGRWAVGRAGS